MASSDSRLSGLVALVTGGSRGIGAGCVESLRAAGASVAFCSNDTSGGLELETSLGKEHALFIEADCRVEDDIDRVVAKTVEKFGKIDCLVNNVGTHPPAVTIDNIRPDDFRNLFELNVMSGFHFSKKVLPHLRRSQLCPSIVNIGSLTNALGQQHALSYVATKGAIAAMTRALAIDEASHGVRVNTISPSNIDTPLMRSAIDIDCGGDKDKIAATTLAICNQQLNGKMGSSRDVGNVCVFLASSDARFLTGIDVNVSNGSELKYGHKSVMEERQHN